MIVLLILGVLCLAAALCGLAGHLLDSQRQSVLVMASLAPILMAASVPGAVLLAVSVGWIGAVLGLVTVAACVCSQAPLYVGRVRRLASRSTVAGRSNGTVQSNFTVLHANIWLGKADAGALVREIDAHRADVVTVVELTPGAHDALVAAGISTRLPFSYVSAARGGDGTGIYSRYPLRDEERHDGFVTELLSARVDVPHARSPLVFAVHPVPPWPREPSDWVRELALLRQLLAKVPADDGPVVVAGDFNATHDHKRYRDLLSDRYRDAAVATGAGMLPTYAADRWYPAIIGIDHVLVAGAEPVEVGRVRVPGSDHHGVWARISLPE